MGKFDSSSLKGLRLDSLVERPFFGEDLQFRGFIFPLGKKSSCDAAYEEQNKAA